MQSDHDGAAASGRRWIPVRHQDISPDARVPVLAELALAVSLADDEAESVLASAIHGGPDAVRPDLVAS